MAVRGWLVGFCSQNKGLCTHRERTGKLGLVKIIPLQLLQNVCIMGEFNLPKIHIGYPFGSLWLLQL